MYGMVLLPVVYMIFGLTNTLPDAILTWIGAGVKPLGETQAAGEMRQGVEKHGAARGAAQALTDAKNGGGKRRLAPAGSGGGAGGAGGGGEGNSSDNKPISDTGQAGVSVQPDHVPSSKAAGGSDGGKSNAQNTGFKGIGSDLPPDHDLPTIDHDFQSPGQGNDSKVVSSSEVTSPSAESNGESRSSGNAADKNEGSKSDQISRDAASVNEGGDVRRSSGTQGTFWSAAQKDSDEKAA